MPRTRIPRQPRQPIVGETTARSRATGESDSVTPPALSLPHERDQTTRGKAHPAEKVIEQAKQDVDGGLQDTDLRSRAAEVFDRRWTRKRTPR